MGTPRKPNLTERIEADIAAGDYGLARQRLASHLGAKGYDAESLAKLGQISYDMHDRYQAGRFWLCASAEGDQVESAIAVFLKHAGKTPKQIVAQLPRYARAADLETYPEIVRVRLRRLNLEESITHSASAGQSRSAPPGEYAFVIGCLVVVLAVLTVFVAGIIQVGKWLASD